MEVGEGGRLRALRLEALRADPGAFSSRHEREAAYEDRHWEMLGGGPGAVFVAGDFEGMAGVYLDDAEPQLWGMWVAPAARGRGAGRALLAAVAGWARVRALETLHVGVMEAAPAARALYEAAGFAATGRCGPEIVMEVALHPQPRRIETERLVLRVYEPTELDALHALRDHEPAVRWLYDDPSTLEDSRARLARRIGLTRFALTGDGIGFAVDRDGVVVGDASLALTSAEHRQGELGYIVHPDHQGHGYATEAAAAVLDLAFDVFGLHRVVGRTEPRNVASARVLERLGMRREGLLVENELVKGEWQSEAIYALRQSQSRLRK
jgi:RimJ/RimL family protein N-acetyltransferase